MLDLIREAMAANQADAATYSQGVRIWMAVMSIAFLSSVIFAPWKAGARWILAAREHSWPNPDQGVFSRV